MDRPPATKQKPAPEPKRVDRNTDETTSSYSNSSPLAQRRDYVGKSSMNQNERAAHQRLFGTGAKIGTGAGGDMDAFEESRKANSSDERAWAYRPRSESKDINLPARKKSAAKPLSPSKRK